MMDGDSKEDTKDDTSPSKDSKESDASGMNGVEGSLSAAEAEEDWETTKPSPNACYFPPSHRLLPTPGALALHDGRLAFAISSLTGRFWRGAVALADCPTTAPASEEPLIDVVAVCELPSGPADLLFLGRPDLILSGHDDGCVSLLAFEADPEAAENGATAPIRLRPSNFAMEHDSLVCRLGLGCSGDFAASLEESGSVKLWMLDPFVSVHTFRAFAFAASDLALHPQKKALLAAAGQPFQARPSLSLWDIRESNSGTSARPCGGVLTAEGGRPFSALAWSPADDDWLFAGDRAGGVHLWDLRQLKESVVSAPGVHGGRQVERLAAQGDRLISQGLDRRLVGLEVFADNGIARIRSAGKAFQHSSAPMGLAADPGGCWSSEICGDVWRHSDGEAHKCRLFPELREMEF